MANVINSKFSEPWPVSRLLLRKSEESGKDVLLGKWLHPTAAILLEAVL